MSSAGSGIFPATSHEQNSQRDGDDQSVLDHFVSRGFGNSTISFAYESRILPGNQPRTLSGSSSSLHLARPPDNILFPCRSLWISATCAIFLQSPKLEALAVQLTGSEFPSRMFRNRCEIWRLVSACLFFSGAESGFCLHREV